LLSRARTDPELETGLVGLDRRHLSSLASSHRMVGADSRNLSYRCALRMLIHVLAPLTSARTNGTAPGSAPRCQTAAWWSPPPVGGRAHALSWGLTRWARCQHCAVA